MLQLFYESARQSVRFPDLIPRRQTVVQFDATQTSSDGGAVLLKGCDQALNLSHSLANCIADPRTPQRVQHSVEDRIRQRVFSLATGYEDRNDADRLRSDPVFKLLLDRSPAQDPDLASQPTLSRFENSVSAPELLKMGAALARQILLHQRQRHRSARSITIDADPTCDPTHGQQQQSLFNGFYDTNCYLPQLTFVSFDNDPEQFVVAGALCPGTAPAANGLLPVLKRLVPLLGEHFPTARLRLRLDAGFQDSRVLDWVDAEGLELVLAVATNPVLQRHSAELEQQARKAFDQWQAQQQAYEEQLAQRQQGPLDGQEVPQPPPSPKPRFDEVLYRAGSWGRRWRVLMKAEMVSHPGRSPRMNVRYVATNVQGSARGIYERIYCKRGDVENRIKGLKAAMGLDRTSCHRFLANQLRVLLSVAAFALLQELRGRAAGTAFARTQATGLQLHLLKLGARVRHSSRRVVLHLPQTAPAASAWLAIATNLGALLGT